MDWIDPKRAAKLAEPPTKTGRSRKTAKLEAQLETALAQPMDAWSKEFKKFLSQLSWPPSCSVESSFLWSALMEEQAEVLVRSGYSPEKLAALVASKSEGDPDYLSSVMGLMDESLEATSFHWLETADVYPQSSLGLIATAWLVPKHARRPENTWLTQWLRDCWRKCRSHKPASDETAFAKITLQSELPLLLAVGTASSKRSILNEASRAMDALAEALELSEDDPAPWLMHGATYLRAGLASVLRCRLLADALGLRKWYPPQQKALAGLLKHAARWCRPDGTQLLGATTKSPKSNAIWNALAAQTKNSKSLSAAMTLSGIGTGKRTELRKSVNITTLPETTTFVSSVGCASMQSDWRQKGGRIALDFSETDLCIEALGPKGESLIGGYWTTQVEVDGQAQLQLDEWSEVCWFSDDDIDYLEVEAKFGQHAKIQRQIALFREERFLFLADSLSAEKKATLKLKSELPLTDGVEFVSAGKTTEGFLVAGSAKCLMMPLYLPEWRRQLSQSGDLSLMDTGEEGLSVVAEIEGKALYTPVVLSLCNGHAKSPFTWRQLTVADELRIVGKEEAQAFRVQIGSEQWFLYRNLGKPIRRTALGMHTLADFYAGRFDAESGELDEIIEVEPLE